MTLKVTWPADCRNMKTLIQKLVGPRFLPNIPIGQPKLQKDFGQLFRRNVLGKGCLILFS